jgi:hypothetical protein
LTGRSQTRNNRREGQDGVPGAILAGGTVFNSPGIGSTCCVGSISVSPSVPIGAGPKYWIIARAATSTTFNGWNWSCYGGNTTFAFSQNGTTWATTFAT